MYPEIDPSRDDFFAYSFRTADLMEKILLAAGAHNNLCMWNIQSSLGGIVQDIIAKINYCI
jgi:hypothetical protein